MGPASMQPQVQALVNAWTEAFNAGRTDDLAEFYAPDARLVPPGRPALTGSDALRDFFADIRAQGFRDYEVEIEDVFAKNGSSIASGRWSMSGPGPDGASHRYEGNWLLVLDATSAAGPIIVHMWN